MVRCAELAPPIGKDRELVPVTELHAGDVLFDTDGQRGVVAYCRTEGNTVVLRMRYRHGGGFPQEWRYPAHTMFVRERR